MHRNRSQDGAKIRQLQNWNFKNSKLHKFPMQFTIPANAHFGMDQVFFEVNLFSASGIPGHLGTATLVSNCKILVETQSADWHEAR
jgi:hypothetical protein